MSSNEQLDRSSIDLYLKELGTEYRKRAGRKARAELILIGGASVLLNYGFRESTTDVDAIIWADSVMKSAIYAVADKYDLPRDWLNSDFRKTTSFSERLRLRSDYYKTFANVLDVRTVRAEYLVAMKLIAGRIYKNDLSDIIGVIRDEERAGNVISKESIEKALEELYGHKYEMPEEAQRLMRAIFSGADKNALYDSYRKEETENRSILLEAFQTKHEKMKKKTAKEIIEDFKRNEGKKRE